MCAWWRGRVGELSKALRGVAFGGPTSSFASEIFKFNEAADSIDMRLPKDESAGLAPRLWIERL